MLQSLGRVWDKLKKKRTRDIILFFVTNILLNFIDIISDGMTAVALSESGDTMWSNLTILWMFAPFLVELLLIALQKRKEDKEGVKKGVKEALVNLPLMIPIVNSFLLWKLTEVKYSNTPIPMASSEQEKLENIRMQAGKHSLMEGYMESGPQLLLQIHIVLCTGTIKPTQMISIGISMISLTVAACRGFYMKRDEKRADPEPSIHMILSVVPYMMCVLLFNISSWTFIMGILKGWTFLVLFVIFLSSYLVHKGWDMRSKNIFLQNPEHIEELKPSEKHFFSVLASIVALWIPCIIGKTAYTFTLTSITSTTLRTIAFILSFVLAIFNLVPENPFLLYCSPRPLTNASQDTQTHTFCYNISNCVDWSVSNVSLQKIRVCDQTIQDPVFIFSASFVFGALVFSIIGTFFLNKLSDYEYMFQYSRSCSSFLKWPIFPNCLTSILSPIIHRSLVFTYIENKTDVEAAAKLKNVFKVSGKNQNIASRQLMGKTPMDICVETKKPDCAKVLVENGAQIEDHLLTLLVADKNESMVNVLLEKKANYSMADLLLAHGAKVEAKHLTISVENKDHSMTNLLLAHVAAEHLNIATDNGDVNMARLLTSHTHNNQVGPIHQIINKSQILSVLENQEMKEEEKAKIVKRLQTAGVTVDEDNLTNNTSKKVVEDWNKDHPEEVVEIQKRKISDKHGTLLNTDSNTSDKNDSMGGEKSITAMECKRQEWVDGHCIYNLRMRYGDVWGEWHNTGGKYDDVERIEVFTLEEGEKIIRVNTRYGSVNGTLCYL